MVWPGRIFAGAGFARLRAAGIEVVVGPGAEASRELNIGFFSRMVRQLPWVRLKVAASLDGKTALDNGTSQWITAEAARTDGHAWRARACAVLTGIGTVLADDPQWADWSLDQLEHCAALGPLVINPLILAELSPRFVRASDLEAALAGLPFLGTWLDVPLPELERRVAARTGDASDADLAILRRTARAGASAGTWLAVDGTRTNEAAATIRASLAIRSPKAHI